MIQNLLDDWIETSGTTESKLQTIGFQDTAKKATLKNNKNPLKSSIFNTLIKKLENDHFDFSEDQSGFLSNTFITNSCMKNDSTINVKSTNNLKKTDQVARPGAFLLNLTNLKSNKEKIDNSILSNDNIGMDKYCVKNNQNSPKNGKGNCTELNERKSETIYTKNKNIESNINRLKINTKFLNDFRENSISREGTENKSDYPHEKENNSNLDIED